MKIETWIFTITAGFFLLVTPGYWLATAASAGERGGALSGGGDWTGTVALAMTFLLAAMVALYLGFHARQMDERPEDNKQGEIADGAGELGFFPPYSWWPLLCALSLGVIVLGIAVGAWWMVIIGFGLGGLALSGLVFEYYRGEHAH